MPAPALHHVAFACRDVVLTHHFYQDVLGLPLVHTEIDRRGPDRYLKHTFYDLGDGSCIAFFDLHGMGEPEPMETAISTGLGLPVWVNHLAIRATEERVADVRGRLEAAGVEVTMERDHDWCQSLYVTDPNGILIEFCVDTPGLPADRDEAEALMGTVPS